MIVFQTTGVVIGGNVRLQINFSMNRHEIVE